MWLYGFLEFSNNSEDAVVYSAGKRSECMLPGNQNSLLSLSIIVNPLFEISDSQYL